MVLALIDSMICFSLLVASNLSFSHKVTIVEPVQDLGDSRQITLSRRPRQARKYFRRPQALADLS
jgi:hypothetical protein